MKRSLSLYFLCSFFLLFSLAGCKSVESPGIPFTESSTVPAEPEYGNIDPFTGLGGFPQEAVNKKPASVMVSNIKTVKDQQYGLSSAGICYETVAEGGITRILAIFSNYTAVPKTGPVRSVREYYVDLATPLQTIFVHWGGSNTGYSNLQSSSLQSIDGMTYSSPFTRDQQIAKSKGQEHSNFIDAKGIAKGIELAGIDVHGETSPVFDFVKPDETVDLSGGQDAVNIKIPFSTYVTSTFDYDSTTEQYKKGQFGGDQLDANTGNAIMVDNIFILYDSIRSKGNEAGHMEMDLDSGNGLYISKGKAVHITWSKGSRENPFVLKDEHGNSLRVNTGKSWVNIVPKEQASGVALIK